MLTRVLIVAVLALLAGCGGARAGSEPVGDLVASWDENQLEGAVGLEHGPMLIATRADRQQWLEGLGSEPRGLQAVLDVDLDPHVLVFGAYFQCTETSEVYVDHLDAERALVRFELQREEGVVCDHMPLVLDVWQVPRTEAGDRQFVAAGSAPAPDTPQPTAVGDLLERVDAHQVEQEDLMRIVADHPAATTAEQRGDLVAALEQLEGAEVAAQAIASIDADGGAVILAGYFRCQDESAVWADLAREPAPLWVEITSEPVDCAEAPFTVDLWHVAPGEVPDRISVTTHPQYRAS